MTTCYIDGCGCWVASIRPETRFGLHWGAHSLACPVYRESLDPVDRVNDSEIRRAGEAGRVA